jgi:hypothetical protein
MASVCPLAKKMSSGRLTQVAKKRRVSRATVCRPVNESGRCNKTGTPEVSHQEIANPHAEESRSQAAA